MPLGCSPWSACRRVAVPASSVKTVFWPQTLAQLPRRASAADSLLLQAAMIVPAGLISSRLGCAGNANSTAAQQQTTPGCAAIGGLGMLWQEAPHLQEQDHPSRPTGRHTGGATWQGLFLLCQRRGEPLSTSDSAACRLPMLGSVPPLYSTSG